MKIIFRPEIGFFACLSWAMHVLAHGEKTQTIIEPVFSNGLYGENWMSRYIGFPRSVDGQFLTAYTYKASGLPEYPLTRIRASELFYRYCCIDSCVLDDMENYDVKDCLGAHYRSTDKTSEARNVSFRVFRQEVDREAERINAKKIFFATDIGSIEIPGAITHNDVVRGRGFHSPAHWMDADKHRKGLDAIVNSLLLSQCRFVVRTRSRLSAWSRIFNPQLKTRTLNSFYAVDNAFPEESDDGNDA